MRIKLFLGLLLLCIIVGMTTYFIYFTEKEQPMVSHITLALGESGEALIPLYPKQIRVSEQPMGVNFYSFDFTPPNLGFVEIQAGKHSLSLDNVLWVMGTEDLYAKNGITSFEISAGLSAPQKIEHEQARLNMMAIFKQLLAQGWRYRIYDSDPRLQGREAFQYMLQGGYNSLDPNYAPTFDEWMKIENHTTSWKFYANHHYLSISFIRDDDQMDPKQLGTYLVNYTLKTEDDLYRYDYGRENIAPSKWRALWKESGQDQINAAERLKEEIRLKALGYHIDTSYQNPVFMDIQE